MAEMAQPLVNKLHEKLEALKAEDIMTRDVITVDKDMDLAALADLMIKKRVSGFPVAGPDGKLLGIITSTDLFTLMDIIRMGRIKMEKESDAINPKINFAMTTETISISKDATLDEIIYLMKKRNIHTLPVCENEKLAGVIGRRDVFKHFYALAKSVVENR
ncbi:MAG: CBS domain-containing protein [Candidatus Omnitrophota bacterium]|nr:CBS domain-containing protein [Candidatus Omnitrophota bacterium]